MAAVNGRFVVGACYFLVVALPEQESIILFFFKTLPHARYAVLNFSSSSSADVSPITVQQFTFVYSLLLMSFLQKIVE